MPVSLEFDHVALCAPTLEAGAAYVEERLGVALQPGGRHPDMGTHNRLLSLGGREYLEVIAIDPEAPPPPHARWFGLDDLGEGVALRWIVRTEDLADALAALPGEGWRDMALRRGEMRWRMGGTESGHTPFDDTFPNIIDWGDTAHPAPKLTDRGVRRRALRVAHPDVETMLEACPALRDIPDVSFVVAESAGLQIILDTPGGERVLP